VATASPFSEGLPVCVLVAFVFFCCGLQLVLGFDTVCLAAYCIIKSHLLEKIK